MDLSHLEESQGADVRQMLQPFATMRWGQLGQINVTQHPVDLLPGSWPSFSQPYRAGAESRKIIENNDMLAQGVI